MFVLNRESFLMLFNHFLSAISIAVIYGESYGAQMGFILFVPWHRTEVLKDFYVLASSLRASLSS